LKQLPGVMASSGAAPLFANKLLFESASVATRWRLAAGIGIERAPDTADDSTGGHHVGTTTLSGHRNARAEGDARAGVWRDFTTMAR
jgi:hypothetical protein